MLLLKVFLTGREHVAPLLLLIEVLIFEVLTALDYADHIRRFLIEFPVVALPLLGLTEKFLLAL